MAAQGGFYSLQDDEDDAGPSRVADTRESQKKKSETRAIAESIDLQDRGSTEKKKNSVAPIVSLTNAWVSERAAPELLAWEGECVDAVCSQIEEQVSIIESLASDAATMEEEHVRLALVELDVERARWLLRSYLRSRLDKIEKHAAHFALEASHRRNCSQLERGYAIQYAQLNASHYTSAVLDFLPENMRGLDDAAPGGARGDMVVGPDLDRPVFIQCLADCGSLPIGLEDESAILSKNTIHLLRYSAVRHLVETGRVALL